MRRETIAIHGGFDDDPTTKAVAVPIYQTAAYASIAPTMPRRCSIWKLKDFATPGSATQQRQCLKSVSRDWRAAAKRYVWPRGKLLSIMRC